MKKIVFLYLCFIILSSLYGYHQYEKDIQIKLQNSYKLHKKQLEEIVHTYERISDVTFFNLIYTPKVLHILEQIDSADKATQATLRSELHDSLKNMYDNLAKIVNVRQLHFHHSDGKSFLRMHKPSKFGDPLFGIRHSLKLANVEKKFVQGFEEGRIFNGYRFVYPIIHNSKHLGSVEISVSIDALRHTLQKIYNKDYCFILKTDVITQKVFKEEQKNYSPSIFGDSFSVDNNLKKQYCGDNELAIQSFIKNTNITTKIKSMSAISETITLDSKEYVLHMIPIKNIEKKPVAYMYLTYENENIAFVKSNYINQFVTIATILTLLFGVIFYIRNRQTLLEENKALLEQEIKEQTEENLRLQEEKLFQYKEVIYSIVDLMEKRDSYTAGHTRRVAEYSLLIGEELNLSKEELSILEESSMLHDIGKIVIPDSILLKPQKLNKFEFDIIKDHVSIGADILSHFTNYEKLRECMMYHHERFDGKGYPFGKKGEEIPLLSRIMIIADAFDAMTTNRIYKPRKEVSEAIQELIAFKGTQFDPAITDIAIKVLKNVKIDTTINQLPQDNHAHEKMAYFFKDRQTGFYNL